MITPRSILIDRVVPQAFLQQMVVVNLPAHIILFLD
jgi:hypothetical protein